MRIVTGLALAVCVAAAGACGGNPDAASEGSRATGVQDSAGVRIVVSRVPPSGFPVVATLSSAPTLTLGGAGAEGASALRGVVGAVTLPDGRIVVADGGSRELRYFDAQGRFLSATGGEGPGPEQFQSLSRMGPVASDTVWVADERAGQLSLVVAGGVARRDSFPEGLAVVGRFADDAYLVVPRWSTALLGEDASEGVRRDTAMWARWWPRQPAVQELGRFPHDEMMVIARPDGPVAGVPPFGRRTSRAVGPDAFLVGDQVTFEIRRHRADGTLAEILRLWGVDLTLTEAVKEAVRPPRSEDDTSLVDLLWEGAPATRPAYTRLLLDATGHLWVAEHVAGRESPRLWLVFSPSGEALGLVTVPAGFSPQEIGADWVLGVETTGSGDRVVRYGLSRGG